jgi:hypothetical protein
MREASRRGIESTRARTERIRIGHTGDRSFSAAPEETFLW